MAKNCEKVYVAVILHKPMPILLGRLCNNLVNKQKNKKIRQFSSENATNKRKGIPENFQIGNPEESR